MIKKLLKKKVKAIPNLIGKEAQKAYESINLWMLDKKGKIECPKASQGMFRDDSYDRTVYKFEEHESGKTMIFSHRHHVQHEGDCLKYLENKTI